MKQFIKYIALIVCACSCWACIDDEIGQEIDYSKPATVKLSIDFSDMQVITPGTRSAGDAIGKMTDVCVLFYKSDGTLAMDGTNPIYHYAAVSSAESANFTKTVPAGTYKVVAVANMGDLVKSNYDKVKRLADLKSISLQWNNTNIAANNQMFGFFNLSSGNNSIDEAISKNGMNNVAPTSFDAPELVLSGDKKLYAKLYRTVAKVTVAFDGEGLNGNVVVTIKSIRLGNLPATCPLWIENKNVTELLPSKEGGAAPSEILTDANFGLLKVMNRGKGESLFPKEEAHSTTGPSLFMFENRQGTEPTSGDKDKTIAKKPYGAFIEIEALYANESTGHNGKIIYRYMLGEDKDSYNNYNLTRNRHYKVTLMLQKSGKEDPYWRVEYTENSSVNIPTEVHISYRQVAKLDIPFTVAATDKGIKSVTAKITDNPWYDDIVDGHRDATVDGDTPTDDKYGFLAWSDSLSDNFVYGKNKTDSIPVPVVDIENGKYKLSVQTESLGFKTDLGSEAADAFTGYNNYSNPRTATITVTIEYKDNTTKQVEVKVVQVPRVVNPIAVYRAHNNDAPFNIRLLNARGTEIESYGPWTATIESGKDWIRIKKGSESYSNKPISSDAGGAIRFDYKPMGTLANENETRCGVIVVRFSNNSVEHKIYVRQGYAPIAIGTSDSKWTSFNYIGQGGTDMFTTSPMEEGSWFKFGHGYGILANENRDKFGDVPNLFKMSNNKESSFPTGTTSGFSGIGNRMLPTLEDVKNIVALRDYSGFGIGYDDNATATVSFDEEAQFTNSAMGRRGFVICDANGSNLFFPTGKRGYGRRRYMKSGGLHYANITIEPNKKERPALIGLPKSMGALYWAGNTMNDDKLSFNYSLSNIESALGQDNGIKDDACFARFIVKK